MTSSQDQYQDQDLDHDLEPFIRTLHQDQDLDLR